MIRALFPESGLINPARRRLYRSLALPWLVIAQVCRRLFAKQRRPQPAPPTRITP